MGSTRLGPDAVRLQLAKILASPEFVKADRLSRFLSFVVDQAQSGGGGQLKEYVIGVEAYGRSESYDPRVDAIVRVEAGRLRAKLERYYDHEGRQDPILISLPKGSYTPTIMGRELDSVPEPAVSGRIQEPVVAGSLSWVSARLLKDRRGLVLVAILLI